MITGDKMDEYGELNNLNKCIVIKFTSIISADNLNTQQEINILIIIIIKRQLQNFGWR